MDLELLKKEWESEGNTLAVNTGLAKNEIRKAIHYNSKSEIALIRRSMHRKFLFGGISFIAALTLLVLSIASPGTVNPFNVEFSTGESVLFYGVVVLSLGIMLTLNHRAYRQMSNVLSNPRNLKDTLKQSLSILQQAINFNIWSDTLMSPVLITWLFFAYMYRDGFVPDQRLWIIVLVPVIITPLAWISQRYAQKLKFGQFADRLQTYLDDLNENNPENV